MESFKGLDKRVIVNTHERVVCNKRKKYADHRRKDAVDIIKGTNGSNYGSLGPWLPSLRERGQLSLGDHLISRIS